MAQTSPEPSPQLLGILQLCHHELLCEDRFARARALNQIQEIMVPHPGERLSEREVHEIFLKCHPYIINAMRDPTEVVRNAAIKCVSYFLVQRLPTSDFYLSRVLPVMVERIGGPEVVEEYEEVRFFMMKLVLDILYCYNNHQLESSFNDIMIILKNCLTDNYPCVKELACLGIEELADCCPEKVPPHSCELVKRILPVLVHRHQKVRMAAASCIFVVILHGDHQALTDSLGSLAERLFDSCATVRMLVLQGVSKLLLQYKDRYSVFHKLVPLILTGLHDDAESLREATFRSWKLIGEQYERENETDLKDQMDYLTEMPKNYPEDVTRENLGCRALVQRCISKIIPALSLELTSWKEDVRLRCSQLLSVLVLHAEDKVIQHLPGLLKIMNVAIRDSSKDVVGYIVLTAEYLGVFVPIDNWKKLLLSHIDDGVHSAIIKILACFIRSTPKECMVDSLLEITQNINSEEIVQDRKTMVQCDLRECLDAILDHYNSDFPLEIGQILFNITIGLIANTSFQHKDSQLLAKLLKKQGFEEDYQLFHHFLPELLASIKINLKTWTDQVYECGIFNYILVNSGGALDENLSVLGPMLKLALHESIGPNTRMSTFLALSSALEEKDVINPMAPDADVFLHMLVRDVLLPALIWKAGKSAETFRNIAMNCLANALVLTGIEKLFQCYDAVQPVVHKLFPILITLCDENLAHTRMLALECIQLVKQHLSANRGWSEDYLITCYPHIIKRLDDAKDSVRFLAASMFEVILDSPPEAFLLPTYSAHHRFIMDSLLYQYDDFNEEYRAKIHVLIMAMGNVNAKLLREKLILHKVEGYNQHGCDAILAHLDSIEANNDNNAEEDE